MICRCSPPRHVTTSGILDLDAFLHWCVQVTCLGWVLLDLPHGHAGGSSQVPCADTVVAFLVTQDNAVGTLVCKATGAGNQAGVERCLASVGPCANLNQVSGIHAFDLACEAGYVECPPCLKVIAVKQGFDVDVIPLNTEVRGEVVTVLLKQITQRLKLD